MKSFRIKIALLTGLVTGLLMIGSGLILWRINYGFNLDRVDREIRNLGQSNLDRVQGGEHWARLEDALGFIAGRQASVPFLLRVKNYDKVVHQSPGWPAGLLPESFPLPANYEGPNAPKPGGPLPVPPRRGEQISAKNPALPLKTAIFLTRNAEGRTWRIGVMGNPYVTLVLAADMGEFNDRMAGLRNTYLATLAVVLMLVAGSAWFVAGRALRPVTALTETAERVTIRGLDQRIPAMSSDAEFNRLVTVFNEMLDRLETSFQQATRFSADASHELKTPLARLQAELEQALENTPCGSSEQEVFSSLLEEVSRLKAIVQKLLLLSLADAGRLQPVCEPVDLTTMLEGIVEDCRFQAPHLEIQDLLEAGVVIEADPQLLGQALQNLAVNAIKYNVDGGRILFEMARFPGREVTVRVANTGKVIPAADSERIFERFYRGDQSRGGQVEGVGLGLSLSREIIRAQGGELTLDSAGDGLIQFLVRLPAP
jgi:signal transduction histidine kinase